MLIVVTGASGFIGRRLLRRIAADRVHEVVSLGELPCGSSGVRDILATDIASAECEAEIRGIRADAIIHLAAAGVAPGDRDTDRLVATNAVLPAKLVGIASRCGIPVVVTAGSCSEYVVPERPIAITESSAFETKRLYGTTKAAGGMLALAAGDSLGVRVGVGRLFNAYGPGEAPHRLLPSLFRSLERGERAPLSIGAQVRDFVFVDDICEGLLRLVEALAARTAEPGAYNVCTGRGTSVAEFAREAARAMDRDESLLGFGDLPMRPDEEMYVIGDPGKTEGALGWIPRTRVAEGVRLTLEQRGRLG